MVSLKSFKAPARSPADCRCSRARRSSSARRVSKRAVFSGVASVALPCGRRKLRPKPERTFTRSPMLPRLATFWSRMTSIGAPSVLVGIGQQRQEARALDRHRQLTLIEGLGPGDAARNDLAGLGDVALERAEILVVDRLHALGREAAELLTTREAAAAAAAAAAAPAGSSGHCHDLISSNGLAADGPCGVGGAHGPSAAELSSSSEAGPTSSRARSRRRPPSPSSSAALAMGEGSVTAASMLTTR